MWDIHGNCVRKKRVICALKYLFVKNEINNSSYHWFRMLKLDYVFHASKLQTSCFYFHHFQLLTRARSHFIIKPLTIILLLLWYVKIFTYCKILQYYPCNKQKTINARKNTKMRANQDFSQFHAWTRVFGHQKIHWHLIRSYVCLIIGFWGREIQICPQNKLLGTYKIHFISNVGRNFCLFDWDNRK